MATFAETGRNLPTSTFTRLLLVFLGTGLMLNLLIVGFFSWIVRETLRPGDRQAAHYVNYLIDELGVPPDPRRAREIARRSSLVIEYEGPEGRWATGRLQPPPPRMRWRGVEGYGGVRIGGHRGLQAVEVDRGGRRYVFELPRRLSRESQRALPLALLAAVITLLVGGAWIALRQVLRPVRNLAAGVSQVAAGNLEHRVPEEGAREFAELASAFNAMTAQLKEVIEMRERLLSDVSHELRSPITRMKLALEYLPAGKAREGLAEDVAEMEQMVTKILDAARLRKAGEPPRREPVDLVALLRGVIARLPADPPGVRMEATPAACRVEGDPDLLATVLRNVVENALKYSGAAAEPVSISVDLRPGEALVQVRDRGPGIPARDLPRIFDPFYRVDRSRARQSGGYGLGLSLSKSIMEAHGGAIGVESAEGEGTTVTLRFPVPAVSGR